MHGNQPVANEVSYTGLGQARLLNGGLRMGTLVIRKREQNARKVVPAGPNRQDARHVPLETACSIQIRFLATR